MSLTRRHFLATLAASSASTLLPFTANADRHPVILTKPIPSSNAAIPLIGLGSSRTFNVGNDPVARTACAQVMQHFIMAGGRMIDSSPMYGSSQDVIGEGLQKLGLSGEVFSTDKVWTPLGSEGPQQIEASRQFWRIRQFDLLQVHNLVAWKTHLPLLQQMKQDGQLSYVGITTSHGRRHDDLEEIMRTQSIDFVQLSYNILDRVVEQRLLPIARERGIAVIANRPFRRGDLIDGLQRYPLPNWASEIDCNNWAQFLLKFIVSHPAVTCAIPATTRVDHVLENMGAATGRLPDSSMRERMIDYVMAL